MSDLFRIGQTQQDPGRQAVGVDINAQFQKTVLINLAPSESLKQGSFSLYILAYCHFKITASNFEVPAQCTHSIFKVFVSSMASTKSKKVAYVASLFGASIVVLPAIAAKT